MSQKKKHFYVEFKFDKDTKVQVPQNLKHAVEAGAKVRARTSKGREWEKAGYGKIVEGPKEAKPTSETAQKAK